jgi:transcriptional regulator with XRE-family HTH domain
MVKTLDTEGKRLKYIREKILNLSQETFGTAIAKHPSAIQKWESNKNNIDPSFKLLLEHVYGINPAWLETGLGEIIFEKRNLNVFQMPIYGLSNKSYADLFSKNNIIGSKSILHTNVSHDLANIFLTIATRAIPGIEKDDLLIISTDCGKGKSPEHYLVEDEGILDVRLLQFSVSNDVITEINHSKISEIAAFPFTTDFIKAPQLKGRVIKTFTADLWRNATVILM